MKTIEATTIVRILSFRKTILGLFLATTLPLSYVHSFELRLKKAKSSSSANRKKIQTKKIQTPIVVTEEPQEEIYMSPKSPVASQPTATTRRAAPREKRSALDFRSPEFNMEYLTRTNLAADRSPRIFQHQLSLGASLSSRKTTTYILGAQLGLQYMSLERDVIDQEQKFDLQDFTLTADMNRDLDAKWNWGVGASADLPLSQDSQYKGYKGVYSVSGSLRYQVNPTYSLAQNLGLGYIVNEYLYSPTTPGARASNSAVSSSQVNPEAYLRYSLGQNLRFNRTFSGTLTTGAKMTRTLVGDNEANYNVGVSLNSRFSSFSLRGFYSYGGYTEPGMAQYWFIDETRHLIGLAGGYEF